MIKQIIIAEGKVKVEEFKNLNPPLKEVKYHVIDHFYMVPRLEKYLGKKVKLILEVEDEV